ncbi:MAG: ABC transporter ATP-binding protein [Rhodospirillales bacterium]|nr:ABC transporter ATP-binding protein [Rhodospirillales bacterium]MDH3914015.1 ABC transporter ATP-binding protein [Rhodospirillales bacterium]MDH3920435.1 ABC transporter ATP-binding protein [Rhodospirillales bacterium]MDH3965488.1 ABC transporter ATP-binding protein [Rhodospirillales bacterium]
MARRNALAMTGGNRERAGGVPRDSSGQSADIEFAGVTKRFGEVVAVDDVSLSVERGAFYTFLGPSGCGKTTSLRLIAGFEQPDQGDVRIGGASVVGIPPYKRPVNMVFQHYALFPHLTVADNIGYGLRQRAPRPTNSEITGQVGEMLELVRLSGFETRRVWELSGGQQQRVALARALINHPTVLLLDEPLAALDRKLRREMQIELQTLQREVGITFVLVTHDQEEALSMSDTICIMRDGRIVQTGGPKELYDEPVNGYVADFVGKSNFFAGKVVEATGTGAAVELEGGRVLSGRRPKNGETLAPGARGVIAVRPELVHVTPTAGPTASQTDVEAPGRVKNRIFLGEHTEYLVGTQELGDILALVPKHVEASDGGFTPGDEVRIGWRTSAALSLAER